VSAVTGFVSWSGCSPALASVNRMVIFNLLACGDGLFAEVADHIATPP
jgi:hypothetical protein